jgi:hypothetical protein
MVDYFVRIAAWLSQGINCIFLGGLHDQTVSARAYLNQDKKIWGLVYSGLNSVFFWQEDHCRVSHESDVQFAETILATQYLAGSPTKS